MQMRQLRSYCGQLHLARSDLVTGGAAELLEELSHLMLCGRGLILWQLGDDAHRFQRGNAPLKSLCFFLALRGEAKLAIETYDVAILATVGVKDVLGELFRACAGGDHPVQLGRRLLRRDLRRSG